MIEDLYGRIDAVIDGGDCDYGLESTVLDVSGEVPILLRPGSVTYEQPLRGAGRGGNRGRCI